jgi:hypothetical protein
MPVSIHYLTFWACLILSNIWQNSDKEYAPILAGMWLMFAIISLAIDLYIDIKRLKNKKD